MSVVNICLVFFENSTDKTVRQMAEASPLSRWTMDASLGGWHSAGCLGLQVIASLLVSLVLLGFKLNAPKQLLQVIQRRKELSQALEVLQPQLEADQLEVFLANLNYDKAQRRERIGKLALASSPVYSTTEKEAIERCLAMCALFERSSGRVTQLSGSKLLTRLETKYDEATRLLFGRAECEVRAAVQDVLAFYVNIDSRHIAVELSGDPAVARWDLLEEVNGHHVVSFVRGRARGVRDRTFLTSVIAKQIAEDPPSFLVAVVPLASHVKINRKDEAGAIRAEVFRSFRVIETSPGVTKLEVSDPLLPLCTLLVACCFCAVLLRDGSEGLGADDRHKQRGYSCPGKLRLPIGSRTLAHEIRLSGRLSSNRFLALV